MAQEVEIHLDKWDTHVIFAVSDRVSTQNSYRKLIQHLVKQNDVEAVAAILRCTVPPFGRGNKASSLTTRGTQQITGLEAPKSPPALLSKSTTKT